MALEVQKLISREITRTSLSSPSSPMKVSFGRWTTNAFTLFCRISLKVRRVLVIHVTIFHPPKPRLLLLRVRLDCPFLFVICYHSLPKEICTMSMCSYFFVTEISNLVINQFSTSDWKTCLNFSSWKSALRIMIINVFRRILACMQEAEKIAQSCCCRYATT